MPAKVTSTQLAKALDGAFDKASEAADKDGVILWKSKKEAVSLFKDNLKSMNPDVALYETLNVSMSSNALWMLAFAEFQLALLRINPTTAPLVEEAEQPQQAGESKGGVVEKAKTIVKDAVAKADKVIPGGNASSEGDGAQK